ncbi:MAG: hypothetical protein IH888_12290, partial [Planctomycetes bacterium]|nr:hypothetical protein [Planctomycetota bacterium]
MRQGIHRSRTAGLFLLAAMLFSASVSAGPVILGGDDLTQHGSRAFIPICTRVPLSGVTVAETEPNDTFGTADPIALGDDYAGFLSFFDSDFLSFAATGGETLFVDLALGSPIVFVFLYDTNGLFLNSVVI